MKYWLLKSEPSVYPWEKLLCDKRINWDGVRNHQAANNMRSMKKGDRAFFYHSNEGKEIVGITEIVREYYPDPTDDTGKFVMVDIAPIQSLKTPVALSQIKSVPELAQLPLIRQSRLSVVPVSAAEWRKICEIGGAKSV